MEGHGVKQEVRGHGATRVNGATRNVRLSWLLVVKPFGRTCMFPIGTRAAHTSNQPNKCMRGMRAAAFEMNQFLRRAIPIDKKCEVKTNVYF